MKPTGLHLLMTYTCTYECDHCFVWGSPRQPGVMTLTQIRRILEQAKQADCVNEIYFEGGEPFLYYPVLVEAVKIASGMGFQVGIVSNAYWAAAIEDSITWLKPFAGLVQDLSISSDLFHNDEMLSQQARYASDAAHEAGIPCGLIQIAGPVVEVPSPAVGKLHEDESSNVMYRGRAAVRLALRAAQHPWESFNHCPYEDLEDPGRLHVDPYGWVHICQGISIGNLYDEALQTILERYSPWEHPISAPLLAGGPAELARHYNHFPEPGYADACHLCYTTRTALRSRFPKILLPDPMYGDPA